MYKNDGTIKMKKLLFICGLYPQNRIDEIKNNSKNFNQDAAEIYQNAIIRGLIDNGVDIDFVTVPFIGAWPRYYKRISYAKKNSNEVGFCNVFGIRNISRYYNLRNVLKSIDLSQYDSVLIYSVHSPFVKIARFLKHIKDDLKIGLFVPDIPEYMNLRKDRSMIYKALKKIDIKSFYKSNYYIDYYILLTEQMSSIVNLANKPYVVLEGFIDETLLPSDYDEYKSNMKSVVYTGTLNESFGVKTLIEAFMLLNRSDCKLVICGSGDLSDYIKSKSVKLKNIVFLGQISRDEATRIQREAFVLVNPRTGSDEYTRYSFPSKILQYLVTGRPIIAYKLEGIPKEYYDFFYCPNDDSVVSLSKTLSEVLDLDKQMLRDIYNNNVSFSKKKTTKLMTSKIVDFLNELVSTD